MKPASKINPLSILTALSVSLMIGVALSASVGSVSSCNAPTIEIVQAEIEDTLSDVEDVALKYEADGNAEKAKEIRDVAEKIEYASDAMKFFVANGQDPVGAREAIDAAIAAVGKWAIETDDPDEFAIATLTKSVLRRVKRYVPETPAAPVEVDDGEPPKSEE